MRFIIRELAYEKPIAAGQMRYERDGRATGAVEQWRLTSAASGYRFLRVDLDARGAESGDSYLYHLVLNEKGRPERLSYRFWGTDLKVSGNVLLEDELLTSTRDSNGVRYEDLAEFGQDCGFWFPASIGLGLLANCAHGDSPPGDGPMPAVTLSGHGTSAADAFALRHVEVQLRLGRQEKLRLMRKDISVRPLTIRWDESERTIWLDEHNWPVKMRREDGLTAVETRYVRFS